MIQSIRSFIKSIDFFKSLTLLIAVLIPLSLFSWFGQTANAVSLVMGVFLCAPSDVPGSMRHMAVGIMVSSIIITVTILIMNLSFISIWIMLPVMSLLVFFSSMLSVYGFRASLVSFSGLLAVILSFAHPVSGNALLIHCGLIFSGGIWYLAVTMLAHKIASRRHNQLILAECMKLTASYLTIRSKLLLDPDNATELRDELFQLQTQINEKHEKLREIFVAERMRRSGSSNFANKYILIFIELIDILELTISIPSSRQVVSGTIETSTLKPFADLLHALGNRLRDLAEVLSGAKMKSGSELQAQFSRAQKEIARHQQEQEIMLKNFFDYQQRQLQKVESIERVLQNLEDQEYILYQSRDAEKFLTQQDYDPALIGQNLNTGSTIFRHATRLVATVLVGYAVGSFFHIQNPYWIMLTIIVIMRPSYGLTKSRSIQRVLGTLIGGTIALGIVLLTKDQVVYGTLAAISLVFAFSLIQKNYTGSAVFITLNIVFLYALIQPDALNVIQYRVFDTAIGAVLAFLASLLLWPSWEFANTDKVIADCLKANRSYLAEISTFYQHKGEVPTAYKLARKEAFLAFGKLSTSFQRMSEEPKSKRLYFPKVYEMVVLNHTFLTAAAAMGTFIRNHTTTEKSMHFQTFIDSIDHNLQVAGSLLNNEQDLPSALDFENLNTATAYLDEQYQQLTGNHENAQPYDQKQEITLISSQLKWLHNLSESIQHLAEDMKQIKQTDQPV